MVLEYAHLHLPQKWHLNVAKYSSTMVSIWDIVDMSFSICLVYCQTKNFDRFNMF